MKIWNLKQCTLLANGCYGIVYNISWDIMGMSENGIYPQNIPIRVEKEMINPSILGVPYFHMNIIGENYIKLLDQKKTTTNRPTGSRATKKPRVLPRDQTCRHVWPPHGTRDSRVVHHRQVSIAPSVDRDCRSQVQKSWDSRVLSVESWKPICLNP